jgi:hypothetical protein
MVTVYGSSPLPLFLAESFDPPASEFPHAVMDTTIDKVSIAARILFFIHFLLSVTV